MAIHKNWVGLAFSIVILSAVTYAGSHWSLARDSFWCCFYSFFTYHDCWRSSTGSSKSLCGDWKVATAGTTLNSTTGREETAYDSYLRMTMAASQEYVQTCLSGSELPECNTFKQRQLYWTSANISCPFDNLCLGAENGSFYMDTGVLDSRDDFGINGRDKERIQFRKNTTCVPIKSDGYMVEGNSSIDFDGYFSSGSSGTAAFNYTAAFYGPMIPEQFADSGIEDSSILNATYIYTNFREMATPMWNNGKVAI